jgi:two-component system chemotaxis response regulator CheB
MGRAGADGLHAVKAQGGCAIVQDPRTAEAAGMPDAAVAAGAADLVLPLEVIAGSLVSLVMTRAARPLLTGHNAASRAAPSVP